MCFSSNSLANFAFFPFSLVKTTEDADALQISTKPAAQSASRTYQFLPFSSEEAIQENYTLHMAVKPSALNVAGKRLHDKALSEQTPRGMNAPLRARIMLEKHAGHH